MFAPAFLPALPLAARAHTPVPRPATTTTTTNHRPPAPARTPPRAAVVAPDQAPTAQELERFAVAVRGEWTGYEGTFAAATAAVEPVPDFYVPEQFAEWGLVPRGFETNYSTRVRGHRLFRKCFRVLPTVSHFADHVDTEEELIELPLVAGAVDDEAAGAAAGTTVAIFGDGSFVAGPRQVAAVRASRIDMWPVASFCVRDPRRGQRRAANVWVRFDFEKCAFEASVRAVVERWSCDHCDGADLDGSSGFVDGWTTGAAGGRAALAGEWRVCADVDESGGEEGGYAMGEAVLLRGDEAEGEGEGTTLFLPEGVDVGVRRGDEGGVTVHAAWLVDADTRAVVRRSFDAQGGVQRSERVVEHRIS